ncbi:hypothetical protein K7X08_013272 [Anisodus acutangulus]|uniref:Uncharacterized protein n=1 Tax=Anisodus acutangulus TaxID=402998 RepID=A0A9Q1MAQ8_9SOLA|nr:hypothetical protein K7X08_013272 [Anisodus acutangulus]
MTTNNDDPLHEPQKTKEQRLADRNMRHRTRYSQMSPERKQLFLSQLLAKRAESKRQRLLQHSNNVLSSSQVNSQDGNQSLLPTSDPSLARDEGHASAATETTDCTSISEVGSTSSRCDAVENFSSPVVTSNRAGIRDRVASSLASSFHQSEASTKANGCQRSPVAKSPPSHATGIQGTSVNPSIQERENPSLCPCWWEILYRIE